MPDAATSEPDQRRFVRRVLIVVGVVGLVSVALVILGLAWTAMLTLFGGALIGVLIDGVSGRLARWTHLPRTLVLVVLLLLTVAAVVGAGFWLGPAIGEQLSGLREQLMAAVDQLRAWLEQRAWGVKILDELRKFRLTSLVTSRFGGLLSTTVGAVGSLILIGVFGVYFAIDPEEYLSGVVRLFPQGQRGRVREIAGAVASALRSWLVGRFWSMFIIGVGTSLGLWAAGVPLAAPLGILAGLLSFVPNLGPILSAVPGLLIGLSIGPNTALWALLVYVGVQIVESYAITPLIEHRVVSLPPVWLLAFQMLMGISAGIIGLFMATPLLVTIVVVVQIVYVRDVLGDEVEVIGGGE